MNQRLVIENFLGGLADSRYVGDVSKQSDPGPIGSETSDGWNPAVPDDLNILRRGFPFGSLTDNDLTKGIWPWAKLVKRNGLGAAIIALGLDDTAVANKLYKIELASYSVVNASPWPFTLPTYGTAGTGMALFNGYLWYSSGKYLGRYDLSLTFNSCYNISLCTTGLGYNIYHPMAVGNGKLFIGDANATGGARITSVDGSGTVYITGSGSLDLSKSEQIIRALEFDNNLLYIAMSGNPDDSSTQSAESSLLIWDTVSESWQYKYTFPEGQFWNIKAHKGNIYCWGQNGFYQFTGRDFERIYPMTGAPVCDAIDKSPNGYLYFKSPSGIIHAYGSPSAGVAPFLFRPYETGGSASGFLKFVDSNNIVLHNGTSTLRRYSSTGTGGYAEAEWRTPMIPFGRLTKLVKIRLYFMPWTSGASMTVSWSKDDGSTLTTLGTISTAGETSWEYQPNGCEADAWQIVLTHTGGATPKIRRIILEYADVKE